jgi:hypothetical protein
MRLLGVGVGQRVPRAHRNTPEAQAVGQFPDTTLVQGHIEGPRDPFP